MNAMLGLIIVMMVVASWDYQTYKRLELLRKHVNERLARLENAAKDHQWDLPFCSFGFLGEIDDWEV